jgi:cation diffusion facilitator family transporter
MNTEKDFLLARQKRARQVAKVLWVTLGLNWLVAALKVVFGLATHCVSITADGIHSFSDGTSNVVGLVAVTIAGHPADDDHPYGHQKYETLASVLISAFLFLVSFGILREAILGLLDEKTPEVSQASFVVMGVTLFVNLFVVWYERKKGRALKSDLLINDSWHTLTDVFVTLSVLGGLVGIGLGWSRLDSILALVIAGIIMIAAVRILKQSSDVLCDKAVLDTKEIERIVRGVEGVRDCHEIRTRGRMDDVYIDLHVLVDNEMTVIASHRLANIIEHNIRSQISGVRDVVVHIEPVSHGHEEL